VSTKAQAPVQLTTNTKSRESEPTWSADGKYIVYVSDEGKDSTGTPNNDIWIMRADGTQRRQLTTNGSDDITPVVDPHMRWIYFVSNRGFKWGIWRMAWPQRDQGDPK
jgi:Tol biopolymer transport system component